MIINDNLFYFELDNSDKNYCYCNMSLIDIGHVLNKYFLADLYRFIIDCYSIQLTTFNIRYIYNRLRYFIDFKIEYDKTNKPYLCS
jgi:hypothetical protein